jgi:hypothetical protein
VYGGPYIEIFKLMLGKAFFKIETALQRDTVSASGGAVDYEKLHAFSPDIGILCILTHFDAKIYWNL